MKVSLIKSSGLLYDITDAVESITISGSVTEASRSASITPINAPYDTRMNNLFQISTGDVLQLEEPLGTILFYGQVIGAEKSSDIGTITFDAQDVVYHLLQSEMSYNFKNMTPEAIAAQVLKDAEVESKTIATTGLNIASLICDGTSLYDIIMQAYTKAYKINGKKYQAMADGKYVSIIEKGIVVSNFVLSDKLNITKASISEDASAIKNKVVIYDDKKNIIGVIEDADSKKQFGTYTKSYTKEEGIDPQTGAKSLLVTQPTQTLSLEAIGDSNCRSGYGVTVEDGATGLKGLYWITSDSHEWKDGIHTMSLDIDFKNIMDEKENDTEESA